MSSLTYMPNKKSAKPLINVTSTEQNETEQNLMSIQTEHFQSLILAGTRVCRPDLVTWLLGCRDMFGIVGVTGCYLLWSEL